MYEVSDVHDEPLSFSHSILGRVDGLHLPSGQQGIRGRAPAQPPTHTHSFLTHSLPSPALDHILLAIVPARDSACLQWVH